MPQQLQPGLAGGCSREKIRPSLLGLIQDAVNRISQKFILSCLVKRNIFHGLEELCHYLVRNTKNQMCHCVPWKCSQESCKIK